MIRWLRSDPIGRLYSAVTVLVWVMVFALWASGAHA